MPRYATKNVSIDGRNYNKGDILPSTEAVHDRATAKKYSTEIQKNRVTRKKRSLAEKKAGTPVAPLKIVRQRAPRVSKLAK